MREAPTECKNIFDFLPRAEVASAKARRFVPIIHGSTVSPDEDASSAWF